LNKPPLRLAIEFNKRVREEDEWFDDPDDLDRVKRALTSIDNLDDPLVAAGVLAESRRPKDSPRPTSEQQYSSHGGYSTATASTEARSSLTMIASSPIFSSRQHPEPT
jgi:hypothetical protein